MNAHGRTFVCVERRTALGRNAYGLRSAELADVDRSSHDRRLFPLALVRLRVYRPSCLVPYTKGGPMGEYATYKGDSIKIGTCESMYYLREDQRHLISGYDFDAETLSVIRFRFPFPDEDQLEPGTFEDYDRGMRIPGWVLPDEFDGHGHVQFTSTAGYNLCIPCPEQFGRNGDGWGTDVPIGEGSLHVHRNGFRGGPVLVAQGFRDGQLRSVVRCNACGHMWNLPPEMAEEVAVCFRSEADRQEFQAHLNGFGPANSEREQRNLHTLADRILAGYAEQAVTA